MEAVNLGLMYIQPNIKSIKGEPFINRVNHPFFKGKPTERKVTSQHDYLKYHGDPQQVFTIDYENPQEIEDTIQKVLHILKHGHEIYNNFKRIPHEFTVQGMLDRFLYYVENQNFCHHFMPNKRGTKLISIIDYNKNNLNNFQNLIPQIDIGNCNDICEDHNLLCDYDSFEFLNFKKKTFSDMLNASMNSSFLLQDVDLMSKPVLKNYGLSLPVLEGNKIIFHRDYENNYLFNSCSYHDDMKYRLCPCIEFNAFQKSICKSCGVI